MPKPEYGWWERKRGNVKVPLFVGDDPKNFTLTLPELENYMKVLVEMRDKVDAELHAVRLNHYALTKGRLPLSEHESRVRCTCLANVMQFMVTLAKCKLGVMHALNDALERYLPERRARLKLIDTLKAVRDAQRT